MVTRLNPGDPVLVAVPRDEGPPSVLSGVFRAVEAARGERCLEVSLTEGALVLGSIWVSLNQLRKQP